MKLIIVSEMMPTLLFIGMLTLAFNLQTAEASGAIYIRSDGSVDPPTAPIQRDGDLYAFTDNVYDEIVIERDSIVIDGAGHTIQGTGDPWDLDSKGVSLSERNNVTVKNTEIRAFFCGIFLNMSSNNIISGNNITNNEDGISLSCSSNHNSIYNNTITKNEYSAVEFYQSLDNNISENNITNNEDGIYLDRSSNNVIIGNKITNNEDGIFLYKSSNNSVNGNSITANQWSGITIVVASGNTIVRNNIGANSWIGIYLSDSLDNIIYHNDFIDNAYQVSTDNSTNNIWDNGYPSGGNYWSDHVCTGNPSDGSHSYIIDEDNTDRYPFQDPNAWVILGDINGDGIVDIFDVVILANAFGSYPGHQKWNPDADLNSDGVVDIFDVVIVAKNYGATA